MYKRIIFGQVQKKIFFKSRHEKFCVAFCSQKIFFVEFFTFFKKVARSRNKVMYDNYSQNHIFICLCLLNSYINLKQLIHVF